MKYVVLYKMTTFQLLNLAEDIFELSYFADGIFLKIFINHGQKGHYLN